MSCENDRPPGEKMKQCNLIIGITQVELNPAELHHCVRVRAYNRFMVRDFQYNEEEMKADKEEMTRLSTDKKKQFVCTHTTTLMKRCNDRHSK